MTVRNPKEEPTMAAKQVPQTRVEFYTQAEYDAWLASNPDLSQITDFRANNLPLVTALPDLPAVTDFWANNLPLVTALPDLPAVTYFWAGDAIRKLRSEK